ncbi:MAG: hypothetical protein ACOZCO_05635 [Bacteroidota bacterium]
MTHNYFCLTLLQAVRFQNLAPASPPPERYVPLKQQHLTRILLTLTAFLGLTMSSFGQRKLILTNPQGRHVFRAGDEVGITFKGQRSIFNNWKTICKPCDSVVQNNLWTINSIRDNSFIVSRIASYTYDTLSYDTYISAQKDWRKQKKGFPEIDSIFFRDTILTSIHKQDTVKVTEKKEMCVLKFPNLTRKTVYYDSIQSLTFSPFNSQDACSREFVIIGAVISLGGVYQLIDEATNPHPDNKQLLFAAASIIFGAISTDAAISIRKNNVETIILTHWKRKTK